MKKGEGLSITTIVVAAIALLVLVVLIAIFTGQMGGTTRTMQNCESTLRGNCTTVTNCIADGKIVYSGKTNCEAAGTEDGAKNICCVDIMTGIKTSR